MLCETTFLSSTGAGCPTLISSAFVVHTKLVGNISEGVTASKLVQDVGSDSQYLNK